MLANATSSKISQVLLTMMKLHMTHSIYLVSSRMHLAWAACNFKLTMYFHCRQSRAVDHCRDMLRVATAGLDSYCPACLLPRTTAANKPVATHLCHAQLDEAVAHNASDCQYPPTAQQHSLPICDVCTQHQQQQGSVKFMVAQQMPLSAQADESSRLADASQTADAGSAGLPGADGKLSEHDGHTGGKAEIQRHGSDMHHLPELTLMDAVDQHVSLSHASNEQILAWVSCSPS